MSFFRRKPRTPEIPPEWMIVGLGNPGPEYRGTRHNVGFDVIDLLSQEERVKLKEHKHRANFGIGSIEGTTVAFVKPMTFMNLSGHAVAALGKLWGIPHDRILVISDEVNLPVGSLRLRPQGSSGGHNGHKSIASSLHTEEYPRIRIGVGRGRPGEQIDHVLSGFPPADREKVDDAIRKAALAVRLVLTSGVQIAMNQVNSKASEAED